MAQQNIQVNLQFNANVKQAQQQMKQLQTQLSQLATSQPNTPFSLTPQLKEAQKSAMDLKIALNNAMNTDTGKLNLNKFQSELNRSGKSIQQYAQQLQTLGPAGVKAFQQVAQAVAQADTKMINLSGGAKKLMDTLGNTVRWQLTSSAIHGVMNAISGTLSYAKELDTSLNNIRIVTGKSADQMARFAKEANKMAKELSTTTTKYTDASLIYYQQGLNDKAVKERTDTTVKLANVAGRTAAEVSEWMTAIWNNFDNGSESLEYYADVITKLGASTASSADEIATGLEKFAAVAETVGLSYEYATSALATVTAETRQSAEVVGTAFKTLFARMEGLKLGDTLEDGTDLNQYSLALEKVGINIKDANGELKDMDTILDQTGTRWATLNKDQQVALAQSVAGIRQYNQFMALMDNWDVMQKNLELAEQANGALNEQNRIYEESVKASQERMKAATEELKALIVGGEDLTPLYNIAGKTLNVVAELLEAFGGLKTILLGVAVAITKLYQPQVANFMSQMVTGLTSMGSNVVNGLSGKGFSSTNTFKTDTATTAAKMAASSLPDGTAQSQFTKDMSGIDMARIENEGRLSESVKQRIAWLREELAMKQDLVLKGQEELEIAEQAVETQRQALVNQPSMSSAGINEVQKVSVSVGNAKAHGGIAESMVTQAANMGGNMTADSRHEFSAEMGSQLTAMQAQISKVDGAIDELGPSFQDITDDLNTFVETGKGIDTILQKIKELNSELARVGEQAIDSTIAEVAEDSVGSSVNATHKSLSSMENIGENTSIDDSVATVGAVDTSSLSEAGKAEIEVLQQKGKALQDEAKLLKDKDAWITKHCKGMKSATKIEEKYKTAVQKNQKEIKAFNKQTSNTAKSLKKNDKTLKTAVKNNDKYENSINNTSKELKDFSKKSEDAAKSSTSWGEAQKSLGKEAEDLRDKIENGGNGLTHWSDKVAGAMSAMAQMGMGVNMLTSSFSQLSESIASGEFTWSDLLSSMTSILFALPMLVNGYKNLGDQIGLTDKIQQLFTKSKKASKAATDAEIISTKAEIATSKQDQAADLAGAATESVEAGAEVASAATGVAEQFSKGPVGWATGIASLAMMAPLLLIAGTSIIGGIASGSSKGSKEAKEEEVSKGTETLEAINENQELAGSVEDLTEEYQALRASGESTAEVLEDMREKIPELIDSYKELAKTMGTSIDTSGLEEAYAVFEKTGDVSLYQKEQEKIDKDIKNREKSTAKNTMNKARELVTEAASSGIGDGYFGDQYGTDLGTISGEDKKIFEDALGDYYKESKKGIRFNLTDSGELVDVYEGMLKARSELEKKYSPDKLKNLEYYNKLNEEIKEMSKNMPDVIQSQQALFDIEKEEALANEATFNKQKGLQNISSVEEYRKSRESLIKKIQEETEWTTAQAEAYLKASDAYGAYESAIDFFGEGGLAGFDKYTSKKKVEAIQNWFAGLSEEERTLAMTIDYTIVDNEAEAKKALEEAREKAEEAGILKEALELEVDDATFETYVEGIASVNKGLKENSNLTKQIALNNLKISKGLETLTKSWDNNFEVLSRGNKASFEYAEAIGEIKTALEEMFGVKPSTEYIEKYKNQLNDMVNGNLGSLQKLQDALAEDYILNMDFSSAINDSWSGTITDAQAQLRGLLDDIDTSVEIGKETTLSSDFLNSVQGMLDAGVIAEEQLENLFRAKGYELNITGWKNMPGPETTMTRTIYDGATGEKKATEIIKQSEDIKVPIINGDTSRLDVTNVSGPAPTKVATIAKSTDKRVIDTSSAEEKANKKKDRLKSLKDEKDRYHEINEIISDTERELERLSKAKDRAFGPSKLALMKDEINKQKELIRNNEELLRQAQDYAAADKKDLIANTANNLSIEFDEYGRIANYEDLQDAYIKRLEQNAGNESLSEDIEKEYEAFKDAAEKYEESLNKVEEQAETLNGQLDELYSKNLEKLEYSVQIKVDMADDDKAYIDFLMQKIEDDAFAAADAIDLLGRETEIIMQKIAANQQGIEDVQTMVANGEITPEQGVEKLREYRDELINLNADLLEVRQTVQDKLTEAFEAWNEKIEEGTSKLEFYGSVLEGYKNIIDIVGKDMFGISDETISSLNKAMISNANDTVRSTKAQLDAVNTTLNTMREAREAAAADGDEESVKEWDKQIKIAEEKSQELTTTLQDNLSTALELTANDFRETVEQIADNFSKIVSGVYDSIVAMREGWDRQQQIAERYLNTYEKTYELNKLNRQIQNNIDKTNNVKSQQQLRALQEEMLKMSKDSQQLSKYDLEYLQKKYDLMIAEQALRDAQNAKSVVRLTKNSEGNFGYIYTADQNAIDNNQQNYEDKLYAFQEYTHKMDEELAEMYIATQEQAYERMQAAAEMYGEGTEAFERERKKILDQYNADMGYITEEYSKLTERNLYINENFNAGVADTYEKTFLNSIAPNYKDFESLYNETTNKCKDSCDLLSEAIIAVESTFKTQLGNAGIDADNFENTVKTELGKVQGDSKTTADEIEQMTKDMNTALNGPDGAVKKVFAFQQSFSGYMTSVRGDIDTTIGKVGELITKYGELAEAAGKDYTPETKPPETVKGEGSKTENKTETDNTGKTNDITLDYYSKTSLAEDSLEADNTTYYKIGNKWYSDNNTEVINGKLVATGEARKWRYDGKIDFNSAISNNPEPFNQSYGSAYGSGIKLRNGDGDAYNPKNFKTLSQANLSDIFEGATIQRVKSALSENGSRLYQIMLATNKAQTFGLDPFQIFINQTNLNTLLGKNRATFQAYKAYNLQMYDTGGYTGDWGPEGRLAMLHQKEIVLNAHDTENFLTAIGIVRDISDQIEKNALVMQYQNQLANHRASVGNSGETLQQEVHITAEFPNATNHNEIEEAFRNLTNLASQYANRKS